MELYKMLKLLEGKSGCLGENVTEVHLKLGSRELIVNHKDLSPDGKTVTIYLQAESKENPDGIHPKYQFDRSVKKTQKQAIKEWLLTGKPITPLDALEHFGCFRLGAYIFNLKKEGMEIDVDNSVDPRTGKRYATYRLKTTE